MRVAQLLDIVDQQTHSTKEMLSKLMEPASEGNLEGWRKFFTTNVAMEMERSAKKYQKGCDVVIGKDMGKRSIVFTYPTHVYLNDRWNEFYAKTSDKVIIERGRQYMLKHIQSVVASTWTSDAKAEVKFMNDNITLCISWPQINDIIDCRKRQYMSSLGDTDIYHDLFTELQNKALEPGMVSLTHYGTVVHAAEFSNLFNSWEGRHEQVTCVPVGSSAVSISARSFKKNKTNEVQ